jgi:hydroxyacyl-ACP dehydratase HTD2-like protein with hotdog domain
MTTFPQVWTPGAIVQPHEFTADEIDLFRFSAVTWNAHRIHYDRPRAEAEGLRGPVVQAHLHGAWLAHVARSIGGSGARLRTLSWQNRAPVVVGERVEVRGAVESVDGDLVTLSLQETGDDGGVRAEGSASVEVRG